MGLSSLTYLLQGWASGTDGFSQTHTIAIVLGEVVNTVWMTWRLVVAWRMPVFGAGIPAPMKAFRRP